MKNKKAILWLIAAIAFLYFGLQLYTSIRDRSGLSIYNILISLCSIVLLLFIIIYRDKVNTTLLISIAILLAFTVNDFYLNSSLYMRRYFLDDYYASYYYMSLFYMIWNYATIVFGILSFILSLFGLDEKWKKILIIVLLSCSYLSILIYGFSELYYILIYNIINSVISILIIVVFGLCLFNLNFKPVIVGKVKSVSNKPEEELAALKGKYDAGLITEEEYQLERKRIIDTL